jgi:hypothetical protein
MPKEKEEKPKGLALLREPFPENQISLLPKPTKKDGKKENCKECGGYHAHPAIHLSYVGHAALTDRLLDADPNWTWEPLALSEGLPAFDKTGGLWIKLTVCGITRLGYGHAQLSQYKEIGSREKEVIGDALRNAAMRFGAALDLWHKGELHVDEEEEKPEEKSKDKPEPKAKPKAEGPPKCKTCEAVMQISKSGEHYFCPNWRDGQKHNTIKISAKQKKEKVTKEVSPPELPDDDFPMFDDPVEEF